MDHLLTFYLLYVRNWEYTYWSKDIILLISDGAEIGVQAWLEAYHDYKRSGKFEYENLYATFVLCEQNLIYVFSDMIGSPLLLRSGAIQAAVNLDFPGTHSYHALGLFFGNMRHKLISNLPFNWYITLAHWQITFIR